MYRYIQNTGRYFLPNVVLKRRKHYIASLDSGTSSTRVIIYNKEGVPVLSHQESLKHFTPHPGWVEQDPMDMINLAKICFEKVVVDGKKKGINLNRQNLVGVGITNQRETTILWDANTGKPLHNAIVWSDKRTSDIVSSMVQQYRSQDYFRSVCGLPLSTYFSALKVKWLMDNFPEIKQACLEKRCLFGTVDSWLIWNLTGGNKGGMHVTDVTNASRTMLLDLNTLNWDENVASKFGIPVGILPAVKSSSEHYGSLNFESESSASPLRNLTGISISGCLGDQQSALVGQLCFLSGDAKTTYGTGCFMLFNTGTKPVPSKHGLLTTVAYKFGPNAPTVYALEGSVAVAGSGINWLRDNMGMIKSAAEIDPLVESVDSTGGVYFVPAFSGLFAPYWRSDATGLLCGLTQHSTRAHVVRAFIKAVCFQNMEVLDACYEDSGVKVHKLCVDGGMTASKQLLQIQSDILDIPVIKPADIETTARGAAIAAALSTGFWKQEELHYVGSKDSETTQYNPKIDKNERENMIKGWKRAARLSYAE